MELKSSVWLSGTLRDPWGIYISTWARRSAFFTLTCSGVSKKIRDSLGGGPLMKFLWKHVIRGAALCWNTNHRNFSCFYFLVSWSPQTFCFSKRSEEPQWSLFSCLLPTESALGEMRTVKTSYLIDDCGWKWNPVLQKLHHSPFIFPPSSFSSLGLLGITARTIPHCFLSFCFEVNKHAAVEVSAQTTLMLKMLPARSRLAFWLKKGQKCTNRKKERESTHSTLH